MLRGRSSGSPLPLATARSRGSNPPLAVDASEHRGTKRTLESRKEVSESTASDSVTKRRRIWNKLPKDKQRTTEARDNCKR